MVGIQEFVAQRKCLSTKTTLTSFKRQTYTAKNVEKQPNNWFYPEFENFNFKV